MSVNTKIHTSGFASLLLLKSWKWRFQMQFCLISRSVQVPTGMAECLWAGEGIPALQVLISPDMPSGSPADVLWLMRQRPKGSRLCDLSSWVTAATLPARRAVTSDSTAAGGWLPPEERPDAPIFLVCLSDLLGMCRLVAVVLQDSGIWNLSQSQFQFG